MKVFYNEKMVAANDDCFSPSASKPRLVVERWQKNGAPVQIVESGRVSVEDLCLAHDRRHVERILSCQRSNGFGNKSREVAAALPYTTGAFYEAAEEALATGQITCAPVSGFHHAGFDSCGGYCTFNGLVVAALKLHQEHDVMNVGILDLDAHYGDGTEDILGVLGIPPFDYAMSLNVDNYSPDPGCPGSGEAYLEALERKLNEWTEGATPQIVLYQAGADLHEDDPLGGSLTTEEMALRDRIVFNWAARGRIPLVWCLAGGYQREKDGGIEPVLRLHDQTMTEAVAALRLHRVGSVC